MTKTKSEGMFLKHAKSSAKGQFFKEMAGRADGRFYEKSAGEMDDLSSSLNAGGSDGDINGSSGAGGEEMGGGMYGTGGGVAKAAKRARPSLKSLLNIAGPGKTRPAVKVAGQAPSDWESDMGTGQSSGYHRPASQQPESLETGGDRFHSTLANPPAAGSTMGMRHGIREGGSLSLPVISTSNLGKHAFDMEAAKNYGKARLDEAKESLSSGASELGDSADKAVRSITKSPAGTAIAGLIGLKMLGRGGRGVARGAGRLFGHKPPVKPSMLGSMAGGLRRLVGGK